MQHHPVHISITSQLSRLSLHQVHFHFPNFAVNSRRWEGRKKEGKTERKTKEEQQSNKVKRLERENTVSKQDMWEGAIHAQSVLYYPLYPPSSQPSQPSQPSPHLSCFSFLLSTKEINKYVCITTMP